MRVLFVCSGNICRSPMAEAYFRDRAAHGGLSHLVVESAGTLGIADAPASAEAIRVMAEIGVDLRAHRSRGLRPRDLATADLIVAMSHEHLAEMALRHPDGAGRRVLLRAWERGPRPDADAEDVPDPIGRSLEFYRTQRDVIVRCVDHLVLDLRHAP